MWDFTKIFSSSDNLYKFLFVGGISMVFIAMFFPLQKQHELQIEKNKFDLESALLLNKIDQTKKKAAELKRVHSEISLRLDGLSKNYEKKNKSDKFQISKEATDLEKEFNEAKKIIVELINQNKEDNIRLEYNGKSVIILDEQIETYRAYTLWLKTIGFIIGLIGLIGWTGSTVRTEKIRKQQIAKNQIEIDELNAKNNPNSNEESDTVPESES